MVSFIFIRKFRRFCLVGGTAPYPDKDFLITWLRTFLQLRNKRDGKPDQIVTEKQVEKLYVQANKFLVVSRLYILLSNCSIKLTLIIYWKSLCQYWLVV